MNGNQRQGSLLAPVWLHPVIYCLVLLPIQLSAEECFYEGAAKVEAGAESSPGGSFAEVHPAWVNSLVGRIFWDFLREKYWSDKVAHKIQKKLSKIRVTKRDE